MLVRVQGANMTNPKWKKRKKEKKKKNGKRKRWGNVGPEIRNIFET